MAVYTQVSAEQLEALLDRYDLGTLVSAKGIAEGVENSNYLIDTSERRVFLTLYEKRVDADDLPFFFALLDHVATRGVPVPRTYRDCDGRQLQEVAGRPACLIEFLPGVSVSHPTAAQAQNVGAALGAMHAALTDFPLTRANALGLDGWRSLAARCGAEGLDAIAPGLAARVQHELEWLSARWPADLPHAIVHGDLFPDNVLMRGEAVGGLIDFYFAATEVRAWDLAVTHAAWSFSSDGRDFDAAVGDALIAGYDGAFGRNQAEQDGFAVLARGACLRFLLTRAHDWVNTPPGAMVVRKDPLAFLRRLDHYTAQP
ncbi:MAG: homoserine kinase [Sphingopyxis sp.]|nr:homoserine kinase [Sphingopyxis sp.]